MENSFQILILDYFYFIGSGILSKQDSIAVETLMLRLPYLNTEKFTSMNLFKILWVVTWA